MDQMTTGDLTQVWLTVTEADGTTRLESRWTTVGATLADAVTTAA